MLLCGLALVGAVTGQAAGSQEIAWRSIGIFHGTCDRLLVAGGDRSAACRGAIVNMVYTTGRSSFAFTDGEAQMMVSFSGLGDTEGRQEGTLVLDAITTAADEGRAIETNPVIGTCAYANLASGRATIRCAGSTPKGNFAATFVSNGEPPDVRQIGQPH
jgi:hypothetical protein